MHRCYLLHCMLPFTYLDFVTGTEATLIVERVMTAGADPFRVGSGAGAPASHTLFHEKQITLTENLGNLPLPAPGKYHEPSKSKTEAVPLKSKPNYKYQFVKYSFIVLNLMLVSTLMHMMP